jgi:hypothetical protein
MAMADSQKERKSIAVLKRSIDQSRSSSIQLTTGRLAWDSSQRHPSGRRCVSATAWPIRPWTCPCSTRDQMDLHSQLTELLAQPRMSVHECMEKLFCLLSVEVLRSHKEFNASPRFELQDGGVILHTMAHRIAVQTAWLTDLPTHSLVVCTCAFRAGVQGRL